MFLWEESINQPTYVVSCVRFLQLRCIRQIRKLGKLKNKGKRLNHVECELRFKSICKVHFKAVMLAKVIIKDRKTWASRFRRRAELGCPRKEFCGSA